jgi:hypothetical protein
MNWRIAGAYFESCNCEAICPCRMIGGVAGGRSTYGICYGALGWRIDEGHAGSVDLSGLAAVLTVRYDDDEPGSPWTILLHVDERGTHEQRLAIELTDGPDGHMLRVGSQIALVATRPVEADVPVACGIPGYDQPGRELYADSFVVDDGPFRWELAGNCAFTSDFEYAS